MLSIACGTIHGCPVLQLREGKEWHDWDENEDENPGTGTGLGWSGLVWVPFVFIAAMPVYGNCRPAP